MDVIQIGLCLFSFVLSVVTVVGYLFFLRPSAVRQESTLVQPRIDTGRHSEVRGALVEFFRSVGEMFPAASKEKNPYRKKLQMAGYRWQGAVAVFYGIKCISALLISATFGIIAALWGDNLNLPLLPLFCGAGLGMLLPDRVLAVLATKRSQRLRTGLPAALDLMILGIESGQSLDSTISDSSRALRRTHPDLAGEMAQLQLELRAGHSRGEAFRNLSERNREPEMRKLCSLFVDSDRFGTALGPALRIHAKYLRTRLRQQAQETARKVGVKLIFPVFFLIFPSVLIVTLGPACMMMYTQLKVMLA